MNRKLKRQFPFVITPHIARLVDSLYHAALPHVPRKERWDGIFTGTTAGISRALTCLRFSQRRW